LLGLGANVSVIEPDDDMRKVLTRRSPEVHVLHGSAESVPVPDGSFDAVFSSSAWHWFSQPDATNEMARLLRDSGNLYIFWNGFSRDDPWTASLTKLRERPDDINARPRGWNATFELGGPFVDVRDVSLDWTWSRTIDQVVALFGTYSGSIIQSGENKAQLAQKVRERLVERLDGPDADGDSLVELVMTLRGTIARRQPR
jgi:SAM-dependent methyltransferase